MNRVKLTQKRESVHPEAVCNDENEVEVEGEIKIRTQRYEDTLTVKTVVKVGLLDRGPKPPRTMEILLTEDSVRATAQGSKSQLVNPKSVISNV